MRRNRAANRGLAGVAAMLVAGSPCGARAGGLLGPIVDLDPAVIATYAAVGDLDHDGFDDLVALLSVWGACPGCPADLDDDGVVGFDDLVAVLARWGPCPT